MAITSSRKPFSPLALSISSSNMTGFLTPVRIKAFIIWPGSASGKTLLRPRNSKTVPMAPSAILTNFLSKASAIDMAMVVLPIPCNPTNKRTGVLASADSPCRFIKIIVARYSKILSFTSSSPKWFLSKTCFVLTKSSLSSVFCSHGIVVKTSI